MKFKVVRTSSWEEKKPCRGAKEEEYIDDNGKTQIGWFINIDSLEELIRLKNKCGDLILTNSIHNNKIDVIEIYDAYRE